MSRLIYVTEKACAAPFVKMKNYVHTGVGNNNSRGLIGGGTDGAASSPKAADIWFQGSRGHYFGIAVIILKGVGGYGHINFAEIGHFFGLLLVLYSHYSIF